MEESLKGLFDDSGHGGSLLRKVLGIVDYREMRCNCVDDSMPKS
jgi:hypothetical protein